MLGVVISHAVPVPDALIGLCRRCVLLIVKVAVRGEFIEPGEVFGDSPPSDPIEPAGCELCGMRFGHSETCPTGKPVDPIEEPPDDMPDSERALLYPRSPGGDKET